MPWWTWDENQGLPNPVSHAALHNLCTVTSRPLRHWTCLSRSTCRLAPAASVPTHPVILEVAQGAGMSLCGPDGTLLSQMLSVPSPRPRCLISTVPTDNSQLTGDICVSWPEAVSEMGKGKQTGQDRGAGGLTFPEATSSLRWDNGRLCVVRPFQASPHGLVSQPPTMGTGLRARSSLSSFSDLTLSVPGLLLPVSNFGQIPCP